MPRQPCLLSGPVPCWSLPEAPAAKAELGFRRPLTDTLVRGYSRIAGASSQPMTRDTEMNETVGFIGLGTMGMPMAANLSKAGVALVVHDASAAEATRAGKLA